jgi:hypothetical protein
VGVCELSDVGLDLGQAGGSTSVAVGSLGRGQDVKRRQVLPVLRGRAEVLSAGVWFLCNPSWSGLRESSWALFSYSARGAWSQRQ